MLNDLRESLTTPHLDLPIGGKKYVVHPVNADAWLRLVSHADSIEAGDGGTIKNDIELCRLALGATFDQMVENVTGPELNIAGVTAWFWQIGNPAAAEAFWQSRGKAPRRRRSTSTSTAAASGTRRRASGSGTSTRRKSKPA